MKKMNMNLKKKMAGFAVMSSVAIMAAFNAFAATGWVQENGAWYYNDASGTPVTDTFKSSGNYKYYLGDDGKMVTESLVEYDGKYYYVDSSGAMETNSWRYLMDEDGEERWFYFDNTGKAYESGWKTIGDKKYHFTDSKMDYGWLNEDGEMLDTEDDAWLQGVYYAGDNSTGNRQENVWLEVENVDQSEYEDQDTIWVYFGSNGKKYTDKSATINGYKYHFDDNGAMTSEWYSSDGTASSSNAYKYYDTTGSLHKNEWVYAIPSEDQNAEDHDNGTCRWFYAGSNGEVVKDTIKTINGKKYIFDENGILQTGLIVVNDNKIAEVLSDDDAMPTAAEVKAAADQGELMYFTENGRKTGKITLELDDDTYTMYFKTSGAAAHGEYSGSLYDNGILVKADSSDEKYSVETVDGKDYLVDTSGKIKKAGTYKDTKADVKYTVTAASEGYDITSEKLDD